MGLSGREESLVTCYSDLDTTHECDGRRTPVDGSYRAYALHRAVITRW